MVLCVLWVLFNSTSNGYFLLVVSSSVYIVYGLHLTMFNCTFSLFINSVLKFWMRLSSREHVFFLVFEIQPHEPSAVTLYTHFYFECHKETYQNYLFEKLNLAPLLGLRLKGLEIKKMRICFALSFHLQ